MTVTDKLYNTGGCIAALGTFDGVHLGHCAVINSAAQHSLPVVVVTSKQNPRQILSGGSGRILSENQCDSMFESLGVSGVVRLDFEGIRNMSAEDYLDMLCSKLGAVGFAAGYNFKFGKNASGSAQTLKEYADKHCLVCTVCSSVDADGSSVSSTRIRNALAEGNIPLAEKLLNRRYCIDFEVVHGDKRGRQMGFPTINQPYPENFALPRFGVYASTVKIDEIVYPAVTNIGVKPTFGYHNITAAETHICGYNGDVYGARPTVCLVEFIRPEMKFDSTEALIAQINSDIVKAKAIVKKTP